MAISKITQNNNVYNAAAKVFNGVSQSVGEKFEKSGAKDFFHKYIEPKGANNSFPVLAGLMMFLGVAPRFLVAAKRNPDDKEATKDELKEIAFRDVQTIVILLFLLKTLNAVIASKVTQKTGIPMTNKPFQKVFDKNASLKDKISDFISHPIKKLKIIGQNILDGLNPMGGVCAKTNSEHISDYSKYTFDELPKLLRKIEKEDGNPQKVFDKIIDGTIKEYENTIKGVDSSKQYGFQDFINIGIGKKGQKPKNLPEVKINAQNTIDALKKLKEEGVASIEKVKNESIKNAITNYLKNEDNSLVKSAKALNAWLRTGALAFEMIYLGFGIPALNQLRLEKKYLKNKNNDEFVSNNNTKSSVLINKNLSEYQSKLYGNFIK